MEFNKNISELKDNLKNINDKKERFRYIQDFFLKNKEKYNPFNEIDTSELKLSLRGLDDYYFLINDTNEELRQHYDITYKNNFKSDVFLKNLMFKRNTFLKHDIDYYYFIIPDKGIVCKDYLPFDPLFTKRDINSIDGFVDFAEELNPEHYFKLDSHINYEGGKTLTFYFLNFIDSSFNLDKYEELLEQGKEKNIYHTFDLLTERNWSYSEEEKNKFDEMTLISFKIPQDFIDADNDIPEEFDFDGVRKSEFFKNPNSFSDKRVLIFRDSSANLLKWFFSFYFKEVFFYWDHGNINPNVIKWYKPDIIIELRTERLLDNIPVPYWVKNEEDLDI